MNHVQSGQERRDNSAIFVDSIGIASFFFFSFVCLLIVLIFVFVFGLAFFPFNCQLKLASNKTGRKAELACFLMT